MQYIFNYKKKQKTKKKTVSQQDLVADNCYCYYYFQDTR